MGNVHKKMQSPVGELTLVANNKGLCAILWENDDEDRVKVNVGREESSNALLQEAERQLSEYFAGNRTTFSVPLDFAGTSFQKSVWNALLTIPYGETRSYGEIARQIGNRKAMRAVGGANRRNPISIIAPCHRVIGASGELTGFAGGLRAKQKLLGLEQRHAE